MLIDESAISRHLSFFINKHTDLTADDIYAFFGHRSTEIAAFLQSKGLVAFPLFSNYESFQPLLAVHLLTSDHVCLRLPPADEQSDHFVKIWRVLSTYDDMGCDFVSTLSFGNKSLVESFLRDGRLLIEKGVLSLVPTNSIVDRKCYGAPDAIDYRRVVGPTASFPSIDLKNARVNQESSVTHELVFPIVQGMQTPDLLKLITDEWEAFQRCRDALIYASTEFSNTADKALSAERFKKLKREVLDDGINAIENRLKAISRKGLLSSVGAVLGSASLFLTNVVFTGSYDFLNSTLAAAILSTSTFANYMEYRDAIRNIKRTPFYFLWKITTKQGRS